MSENRSAHVIKEFISETEEIVESLHLDFDKLSDSLSSEETDPELLNSVFRHAHSIKGLAGMFGFDDMSKLAHSLETLLDGLRLGKFALDRPLIDTLFASLDTLRQLIEGKSQNEDFTINLDPVLTRINAAANSGKQQEIDQLSTLDLDAEILNVLTEYEEHRLIANISKSRAIHLLSMDFDLSSFDQELAEVCQQLKQNGEIISTLPSAGELTDRIAFQILFASALERKDFEPLLGLDTLKIKNCSPDKKIQQSAFDPEGVENIEDMATLEDPNDGNKADSDLDMSSSLRSISRTVRVDIEKLDLLMNIVGELALSKNSIVEICERIRPRALKDENNDLDKAIRILERRLRELQTAVMDVRMVPVGQLFEKMTRIVRRVANEQGKLVEIDIQGADTELDKLIIEDISDPLMHIVRNAIDHGLESPDERTGSGKPEKGVIQFLATQKGNHVVIEVNDDGRGIDADNVRRKALELGLISDSSDISDDQVYDLILMPGFSTRDEVSDLSGRGVGMDVVKNNISSLSGMLEINSRFGSGTSMVITVPITLAIIKALIVQVADATYAIPINSVLETLMIASGDIQTIEQKEVIELRSTTLPLVRLDQWFHLATDDTEKNRRLFVAVVGLADKRIGFVVDDLLGQQDVVIKSLGQALSFVKGIAGAAELGNQKTILVLDVAGLMSEALRSESSINV